MPNNKAYFINGLKDGIPICLGYLAVSFSFGILAEKAGLTPFQAVMMSFLNVTSAGQFAALGLIGAPNAYFELACTQLILNLRYCLMSCALSQKLDAKTGFFPRLLLAHGITDEIFGVSVCREGKLNPFYNYGLMSGAIPSWVLGTFLGVVAGTILSERLISALGIALYGMFIAIVTPAAKQNKYLAGLVLLSMAMSLLFSQSFIASYVSPGFRIIILTIVLAGLAAIFLPIQENAAAASDDEVGAVEEGRA